MSDFKIIGNLNPVVGITETYSIDFLRIPNISTFQVPLQNHEKNVFENQVKWTVHVLERGRWRQTKENEKHGNPITYTFFQRSLTRDGLRIKAEINELSARIDIKPQNAECPRILAIDLLDSQGNKPIKQFTYGEWFIARIHAIHMERRRIFTTLWEDDSKGSGHNKANTFIKSETGIVKDGIADIKFFLDPGNVWLANAKLAPGDQNEGKNHEYYVTAEFFFNGSPHNLASSNTNVPNPDYKPESLKQTPAEQKGLSKKDTKGINKAENKVFDYHETKVSVKNEISTNPVWEKINSVMKVWMPDEKNKTENTCICKDNNFYWSNKLTCTERKKVLEVCSSLWGEANKIEKASELMSIIHLESANTFSPSVDNGVGFSGLIQFSDAAAKSVGTTRSALKKMTFIEQMDYVKKYFEPKKNQLATMTDLYLLVVKPNAVGHGNNPDYILFDESISVPDGDGSNTSYEQRMININREPWVTKYGYASNPPFMKENDERKRREKWVYTRQRKEQRWGFHNGKTTVAEVTQELKEQHYDNGISQIFKGKCEDIEKEKLENTDSERVPWMIIVLEEANIYGGKKQSLIQDRVTTYHKDGASYSGIKDAWCSSFACWCLENSNPKYSSPHSPGSRSFINHKTVEKCDAFYGAIATFSDCNKDGVVESSGHVTFVYGKISSDKYAVLGGNQNNMIKVSSYDCSGEVFHSHYSSKKKRDVYKKFMGFFKPKGYEIKEIDKLTTSDNYSNPDEANKKIGLGSVKTTTGEKDD